MCVPTLAFMHVCLYKACTLAYTVQCMCVRVTHKYTRIHLHAHIHILTCRQTQALNPPFVTRTYTLIHMHIDKAFGERRSDNNGLVIPFNDRTGGIAKSIMNQQSSLEY